MADFYAQSLYKEFENELDRNLKFGSNFLVLSIPGSGVSFFIKKYLEKKNSSSIAYIQREGETLSTYNILDLDFDKTEKALEIAEDYFRKATINQKFLLVINTPHIVSSQEYKSSFVSSHIYSTYFFRARDRKDSDIFAKEINPELEEKQLKTIYQLCGGVGKFTKYFSINPDRISLESKSFITDSEFEGILIPTVQVISQMRDDLLANFNLKENGTYKSSILEKYFELNPIVPIIEIVVNDDLSFSENGSTSEKLLTKTEAQLLRALCDNDVLTREKIADFKWGEDSYDDYSDQAINKTMQRLSKKLKFYTITPIPKVGYKIHG